MCEQCSWRPPGRSSRRGAILISYISCTTTSPCGTGPTMAPAVFSSGCSSFPCRWLWPCRGRVGLGATVVMAADAVVASRNAGLADSHVVIGLAAGDGGAIVWPASTGLIRAKRHLLTGDRLSAEEAHVLGVVTDLVDAPGDVLGAALALARRMAALPPLAVQRTKRALHHAMVRNIAAEVDVGLAHEDVTLASDDVLEALAAFKERRPATYKGR